MHPASAGRRGLSRGGAAIPRLVVPTLDDPPNGDFELRPADELTEWRRCHGPDAPIPGTGRSEREHILAMLPGATLLLSRPESTVVAILHGWFVSWIAAAKGIGDTDPPSARHWQTPEHAFPQEMTSGQLERAVEELRRDPYRYV